jgi:hypothetical protein
MAELREGGCQCGGLRYELSAEPVAVIACHCTDCQKQSGSAFGMSLIVSRKAFRWLEGKPRSFVTAGDSGAPKDCFFCGDCGNRIYNALSTMPDVLNLKPGTLDHRSWLKPAMHVWLDSKQPWTPIPAGVRCFDRNPGG